MQPRRLELGLRCLHVARARIETEERRPKTAKTRFKMRLRRRRVAAGPGGVPLRVLYKPISTHLEVVRSSGSVHL